MQYLRARYYDPATGRFNRLDPFFGELLDPLSLHKYLYVHGDPIQGIDPTGKFFAVSVLGVCGIRSTLSGLEDVAGQATMDAFESGKLSWTFYVPAGALVGGVVIRTFGGTITRAAKGAFTRIGGLIAESGILEIASSMIKRLPVDEARLLRAMQTGRYPIFKNRTVVAAGDEMVRRLLGRADSEKAADFLSVLDSGKYVITEAKGNNLVAAKEQIGRTFGYVREIGGEVGRAEVALKRGQTITGGFQVVDGVNGIVLDSVGNPVMVDVLDSSGNVLVADALPMRVVWYD